MTRPIRIQYNGAGYHVMSRGNLKEDIFRQEDDKAYFLELIQKGAERYLIDVFSYCLMNNHYHLSIRISTKNLHEFMHFIGSSYANYLVRSGWVGHVFAGRYKAICIEEESYFLIVNRYIHLNPVESEIVNRPEEYAWSNYSQCIYGGCRRWIQEDWLVEYFGPDMNMARARYKQFVESAMGNEIYYPENEIVAQALLGSEEFMKRIKSNMGKEAMAKEAAGRSILIKTASLSEVYGAICQHLGLAELTQGDYRRDKEHNYVCSLFIYMARQHSPATNNDIGALLGGTSGNAVAHRFLRMKDRLLKDGNMKARFDADEKRILEIMDG